MRVMVGLLSSFRRQENQRDSEGAPFRRQPLSHHPPVPEVVLHQVFNCELRISSQIAIDTPLIERASIMTIATEPRCDDESRNDSDNLSWYSF
jgi:hypothetical protein